MNANGGARTRSRNGRATGTASDETIVVYIHGIGPKPPREQLKSEWDLALFGKEMGDKTRMAYWANLLHERESPLDKIRRVSLAPLDDTDIGDLLSEAGVDENDPEAREFVEGLLVAVGEHAEVETGRRFGKRVLPLPRFIRDPVGRAFMRFFVHDTFRYFFETGLREQIKEQLIAEIPRNGEPFVLVSHSQGTIAAFEVLTEIQNRAEAALWVTLGSPLGLQEVQDQLKDSGFKLRTPLKVDSWQNFSDLLDPVALDHGLSNDFDPSTDDEDGVAVQDHRVVNRALLELRGVNPHSAVGYLAHLDVRRAVHRATRFDPAARFVLARDVAARFAQRTSRQSVLIEVLEPNYPAVDESPEELEKRESLDAEQGLDTLERRVTKVAEGVRSIVEKYNLRTNGKSPVDEAEIIELRKYVGARLMPQEIQDLASRPDEMHVYAVWRSASKSKCLNRSHGPLNADAARRSYEADGRDIRWAVLDTGCLKSHPHFSDKGFGPTVEEVLDCTTTASRPVPLAPGKKFDADGHGTHVCGIIAGSNSPKNPSETMYCGLAPKAKLVVYKVLDNHGNGEDAWIIKALDDILRRNLNNPSKAIHGLNLSLGGPYDAENYGCGYSPLCKDLRDLWRQGVVVCVAAGNEGQLSIDTSDGQFDLNTAASIGDPANLDDCIAVGSVNADKPHLYGISYFSSHGPTSDGRIKPDVVAPGERITSCNAHYEKGHKGNKGPYRQDSGTSMACPHISGLIAAFLSVRREFIFRPDEVKAILKANCNDLGRDRYHQGAGIPNLVKMLVNT